MIKNAMEADMPFAWVVADAVYGVGDIEQALRRAGKGYVLGVKGDHRFGSWGDKPVVAGTAAQIANELDPGAWQRLSAGKGTKGERFHDWAYFQLADLEADEYVDGATGTWTRGLLIRRHLADGELAFFTIWCLAGTTIETLAGVEGHRRAIEDSFETARNELGLDHNETRSWHGWHRHASLVMLAFAMLAAIHTRANGTPPPPKKTPDEVIDLIRWSVQEIRRIVVRLAQRRIEPRHVIAWSCWRRAHQAADQPAHTQSKMQRSC